MDLQMPEMDGHQATAKIRSDARFASLPIYAMTAHATMEERDFCLANGMNGHIAKPIDPALLFDTLSKIARSDSSEVACRGGTTREDTVIVPQDVPQIEGLDCVDGLRRVGGNIKLYNQLLQQFASQQSEVIGKIRAALAANDVLSATRAAHTLKGVAGNLGAREVQDAAATVESLLRDGSGVDVTNAALTRLAAILDPLLTRLQDVIAVSTTAAVIVPGVTAMQTRAVAEQLTKLFADFDTRAVIFTEENQASLRPAFDDATWKQFLRYTQQFAFADAQKILVQVLAHHPEP
jgi:two-component system sensor histidine kinase/response regulator